VPAVYGSHDGQPLEGVEVVPDDIHADIPGSLPSPLIP